MIITADNVLNPDVLEHVRKFDSIIAKNTTDSIEYRLFFYVLRFFCLRYSRLGKIDKSQFLHHFSVEQTPEAMSVFLMCTLSASLLDGVLPQRSTKIES